MQMRVFEYRHTLRGLVAVAGVPPAERGAGGARLEA